MCCPNIFWCLVFLGLPKEPEGNPVETDNISMHFRCCRRRGGYEYIEKHITTYCISIQGLFSVGQRAAAAAEEEGGNSSFVLPQQREKKDCWRAAAWCCVYSTYNKKRERGREWPESLLKKLGGLLFDLFDTPQCQCISQRKQKFKSRSRQISYVQVVSSTIKLYRL